MSNKLFTALNFGILFAGLAAMSATPAKANTYDLVATPEPGDASRVSGFTIRLSDRNANARLDIAEIVSFRGLTFLPDHLPGTVYLLQPGAFCSGSL